ncbi:TetR/AcrR family transcriptional regulator [Mycolicibacterium sp.]|uniref:TetR/AcrR family transcriptional regulator n=1 Tax=Mycolicibacterium sp. TaxID=2320850 RepID=UPI003D147FFA
MASPPQRRRAARHLADAGPTTRPGPSAGRKNPITVDAVVDAALGVVEREGYDALTMRRVAAALETGPASLYAHVVNKEDLDDLLIGRLCAEITFPEPDPRRWRQQVGEVCGQIRDQYLSYPGISRAALAVVPTNTETLRVSEGLLGIVLAGGVDPQRAAWAIDALLLYINAFCLEVSLLNRQADPDGWVVSRDEMLRRFAALPDTFPHTKRHAGELTAGTVMDRFDFTIDLMLAGLDGQ